MERESAVEVLRKTYLFSERGTWLILGRARRDGKCLHGNPAGPGYITVTWSKNNGYSIEKQPKISTASLPAARPVRYTSGNAKPRQPRHGKATTMPPRGKRAAQAPVEEPEVEEVEGGEFDHHLTKTLSPTMSDYGDWFHANVADIDELGKTDPGRLLALGSTLYPHFQKSDLNQSRRAERKASREAAAPAETEEEAAAPAKGRRGGAAAAPAKAAAAPAKGARRRGAAATAGTQAY